LDEDFPGTLCFEDTQVTVNKAQQKVNLKVKRLEGSDGKISCIVRTEAMEATKGLAYKNASEFDDYLPYH